MPTFDYRAKNANGDYVKGTIVADTPMLAAEQLSSADLLPLDIIDSPGKEAIPLYQRNRAWKRSQNEAIDTTDIMLFARQMSTLQKSGVPILSSLTGLQESSTKKAFVSMLRDIRQSLDAGRDLATTLARHPKQFSDFFISMVRVGEMTGQLSEVFFQLYQYLQFEKDTRERVKAALRYPIFVVFAIFVAIAIVNIFVIPVFAEVFAAFKAPLPFLTQVLITTSYIFTNFWWLIGITGGGTWWTFKSYISKGPGRLWWDRQRLILPIAGPIILKTTLARFCGSLSLSLKSGVPISQSLSVVRYTLDNEFLALLVDEVRQNVERGEAFYAAIKKIGVFPPVVMQMIAVGEETGELDAMLADVAEMYNRETDYEIKGLTAALEPILLVFVACMVLILALGIFLPLWSLGQVAMGRPSAP